MCSLLVWVSFFSSSSSSSLLDSILCQFLSAFHLFHNTTTDRDRGYESRLHRIVFFFGSGDSGFDGMNLNKSGRNWNWFVNPFFYLWQNSFRSFVLNFFLLEVFFEDDFCGSENCFLG